MYQAILKKRNGKQITKYISKILSFINIDETDHSANYDLEEFTELTPDNLINKGGFTIIRACNHKIIRFELIDKISCYTGIKLIYKEV